MHACIWGGEFQHHIKEKRERKTGKRYRRDEEYGRSREEKNRRARRKDKRGERVREKEKKKRGREEKDMRMREGHREKKGHCGEI